MKHLPQAFCVFALLALVGFLAFRFWPRSPRPVPVCPAPGVPTVVVSRRPPRPLVPRPESASLPDAVRIAVGGDLASASRYRVRAAAIASLPRDLPPESAAALLAYVASTGDVLRLERVAALKNDILNVLRRQRDVPAALSSTLIAMLASRAYPSVILDYCVQHLGAMQNACRSDAERDEIHHALHEASFASAASYSGTALYAMADDSRASPDDLAFLRRRTVALAAAADPNARLSAVILVGERGYTEALPPLRAILDDPASPVPLRAAAIAALGRLGTPADLARLSALRRSSPDPRLVPALDSVLHRRIP